MYIRASYEGHSLFYEAQIKHHHSATLEATLKKLAHGNAA